MRLILLILVFILLSKISFSQCDNSLIGKWKVLAVFNGGSYINLKTDSSHLSPLLKRIYHTDSLQNIFITTQKDMYKDAVWDFKNDGNLNTRMLGDYTENIRYCYDKAENNLQLISDGKAGEKAINNRTTLIKNGLLYITISPPEMKEYVWQIVLKKTAAQ